MVIVEPDFFPIFFTNIQDRMRKHVIIIFIILFEYIFYIIPSDQSLLYLNTRLSDRKNNTSSSPDGTIDCKKKSGNKYDIYIEKGSFQHSFHEGEIPIHPQSGN